MHGTNSAIFRTIFFVSVGIYRPTNDSEWTRTVLYTFHYIPPASSILYALCGGLCLTLQNCYAKAVLVGVPGELQPRSQAAPVQPWRGPAWCGGMQRAPSRPAQVRPARDQRAGPGPAGRPCREERERTLLRGRQGNLARGKGTGNKGTSLTVGPISE